MRLGNRGGNSEQKKSFYNRGTNKSVDKRKNILSLGSMGLGRGVYLHPSSKNTSLKTKHLNKFTRRASCPHLQPWRAAAVHYTMPASSTLYQRKKKRKENVVGHKQIQFKSDRPVWKSCVRERETFPHVCLTCQVKWQLSDSQKYVRPVQSCLRWAPQGSRVRLYSSGISFKDLHGIC